MGYPGGSVANAITKVGMVSTQARQTPRPVAATRRVVPIRPLMPRARALSALAALREVPFAPAGPKIGLSRGSRGTTSVPMQRAANHTVCRFTKEATCCRAVGNERSRTHVAHSGVLIDRNSGLPWSGVFASSSMYFFYGAGAGHCRCPRKKASGPGRIMRAPQNARSPARLTVRPGHPTV